MAYLTGEQARDEAYNFYSYVLNRLEGALPDNVAGLQKYVAAYDNLYASAKNKQKEAIDSLRYILDARYPEQAPGLHLQLDRVEARGINAISPNIQKELKYISELHMVAIGTYQEIINKILQKRKAATDAIPRVQQALKEVEARRAAQVEAAAQAEYVTTLHTEQLPLTPMGPDVATAQIKPKQETMMLSKMLTAPMCIEQPLRGTYLPKQCQYPKAMDKWTDQEKQGFATIIQFIHNNRACFVQEPSAPSSTADYLIWQPQNEVCQAVWQKLHTALQPKYHYYALEQYLKVASQLPAPTGETIVEEPFYKKTWFWVTIAVVGAGGVYYYYTRKK